MKHKPIVISGFPGIGKTYFVNNEYRAMDSDSSSFSWIDGESGKQRNPEFPDNYLNHIEELLKDERLQYICVSSHELVRKGLVERGIKFELVYPDISLKEQYLARYALRQSPPQFIKLVEENWENWIRELEQFEGGHHRKLQSGEYLSNVDFF